MLVYNDAMQLAALFDDHQDLLDEFIRFLPDASAVASEHHAKLGRQPLHLYEERISTAQTLRGAHTDKVFFFFKKQTYCVYAYFIITC